MTRNEAIAELVRIWHSPHLDLSLKAGLAEVIDALKSADGDLISRADAIVAVENNSYGMGSRASVKAIKALPSAEPKTGWIPVSDIRKLEDVVYMHIDSLEGTRNIVEAGMLSAWKEVAEYVDGMLGEDGEA